MGKAFGNFDEKITDVALNDEVLIQDSEDLNLVKRMKSSKFKGPIGTNGTNGTDGTDGNTILYGIVDPTTEGVDGNFYINTVSNQMFGPKDLGAWGSGTNLIGPDGNPGTDGVDGKTVLNGIVDPVVGDGIDGDFFINTTSDYIFGPKTAGVWGSGTSLIGPTGPGSGDMLKSAYDPAGIDEQLVGLTAEQTLTNKTITALSNTVYSKSIIVKVKANENLVKGDIVKHNGWNDGENAVEVVKTTSTNDKAIGTIYETIDIGNTGTMIRFGIIEDLDTSAFSDDDTLYNNGAGGYTNVRPIGTAQIIGRVVRSHAINGDVFACCHQSLNKGSVELGNVDNTSDVAKPISTAQQTALDNKVSKIENHQSITSQSGSEVILDLQHLDSSNRTRIMQDANNGVFETTKHFTNYIGSSTSPQNHKTYAGNMEVYDRATSDLVMKVRGDGGITADKVTNTLIDTYGNKSLITKEYLEANSGGTEATQSNITSGEAFNIRDTVVYSSGYYKGDASNDNLLNFKGFSDTAATISTEVNLNTAGVLGGFSGLTAGDYYMSDTPGTISHTPGTNQIKVGEYFSDTELLIKSGGEEPIPTAERTLIDTQTWTSETTNKSVNVTGGSDKQYKVIIDVNNTTTSECECDMTFNGLNSSLYDYRYMTSGGFSSASSFSNIFFGITGSRNFYAEYIIDGMHKGNELYFGNQVIMDVGGLNQGYCGCYRDAITLNSVDFDFSRAVTGTAKIYEKTV